MLLIGLNFSGKVIIVINASRFKRVKDRKYTSIIGILLDVVFNITEPLGLW
jgi:hypothetical protein